jgi:O-antigen ligase
MSRAAASALLATLLALAASNRPLLDVGGLTIRADWVGGALALALTLFALGRGIGVPRRAALLPLGCFVGMQFLSSLLNLAAWPQGLKFSLIYVLALACVGAPLLLIGDSKILRWAADAIVAIGVVQAASGLALFLTGNALGVRLGWLMSERNLFASFLLVPLALVLWRFGTAPRWTWSSAASCGALVAGLVFGLTRAAWIAGVGIAVVWLWRRRPAPARVAFVIACVLAALLLNLGSDLYVAGRRIEDTRVYDRTLRGLVTGRDAPIRTRVLEVKAGVAAFLKAPLLGHGAGSANRLRQIVPGMKVQRRKPWISNAVLFVLVDSGVVGLAMLVWAGVAATREAWRIHPCVPEGALRHTHEALGVGLAATLLAWQGTHGLWQMYGYLYLGVFLSPYVGACAGPHPASMAADANPAGPEWRDAGRV